MSRSSVSQPCRRASGQVGKFAHCLPHVSAVPHKVCGTGKDSYNAMRLRDRKSTKFSPNTLRDSPQQSGGSGKAVVHLCTTCAPLCQWLAHVALCTLYTDLLACQRKWHIVAPRSADGQENISPRQKGSIIVPERLHLAQVVHHCTTRACDVPTLRTWAGGLNYFTRNSCQL